MLRCVALCCAVLCCVSVALRCVVLCRVVLANTRASPQKSLERPQSVPRESLERTTAKQHHKF